MSRTTVSAAVAGLLVAAAPAARAADAAAASPPAADADFLEYLGSWDGNDADWQVMAADKAASTGTKKSKAKPPENASPASGDEDAANQEQQR